MATLKLPKKIGNPSQQKTIAKFQIYQIKKDLNLNIDMKKINVR